MRILLSIVLVIIFTGCVTKGDYHDNPGGPGDPDNPVPPGREIAEKVIPDDLRKSLGVKPNEPLIAIINDKPTLLVSENFKSTPAKNEDAPVGKNLSNVIMIIQTTSSPSCFLYRDIWGNQRNYPVPDCPHR